MSSSKFLMGVYVHVNAGVFVYERMVVCVFVCLCVRVCWLCVSARVCASSVSCAKFHILMHILMGEVKMSQT